MIKRLFGMHHLNITQGRYGGFSHSRLNAYDLAGSDSGIDFYKATSNLTVIAIHEMSKTGFANTVHFYDKENDVTLAMSHVNLIPGDLWVGKTCTPDKVIYMEGTKGFATGNHIHLEIGKGMQRQKIKYAAGVWGLRDWINFEDYFYVDDSITIVNCPYQLEKIQKQMERQSMKLKGIKNGLERDVLINGYKMSIYGVSNSEDVCLVSAEGNPTYTALQPITTIDTNKSINCKINAGFFDMRSGQHFGVEISTNRHEVPLHANTMVFYEYIENGKTTWNWCNAKDFTRHDAKWAVSPLCVINKFGQKTFSTGFWDAGKKGKRKRSLYMWLCDGRRALVSIETPIDVMDIYDVFKDVAEVIIVLDGGDSTQMRAYDGAATTNVYYTGRPIANVIAAYTVGGGKPDYKQKQLNVNTESIEEQLKKKEVENEALKKERDELASKLKKIEVIING